MQTEWKEFEVYNHVKAKALISGLKGSRTIEKIKLITKVPKGQYYSYLNDAEIEAQKILHNEK